MTLTGLTAESSSAFFCFSDWFLFCLLLLPHCLIFRPQNRTAHSLNSTLLERMLSYLRKRHKKVSSYCILCPHFSLPSMCHFPFCSLIYSFSPLPHFSHWKSVMCFCLLPLLHVSPALRLPYCVHAEEFIILELLSCSILISVYIITECPNKMHCIPKRIWTQVWLGQLKV